MPLIIITGFPCSGKTHRAQQLASALSEKIQHKNQGSLSDAGKITVHLISSYHDSVSQNSDDDVDSPARDAIYNSVVLEKTARAYEISSIKRAISKNAVVIVDDLNYIKGFRYQLWCEAKAAGTRCCTIHCASREDEVVLWNRERLRQWAQIKGEPFEDDSDMHTEPQVPESTDEALPESHTAIYGDRIPPASPGSRTSSQGGDDGEADRDDCVPIVRLGETLTTLSLSRSTPRRSPETVQGELDSASTQTKSLLTAPEFPSPTRQPYSTKTLHSLLLRYEPPSPFSRWDTPLFTVPASDIEPPISDIWGTLFPAPEASSFRKNNSVGPKPEVKPNLATTQPRMTEADALQSLERVTADIVGQIITWSKSAAVMGDEGGEVEFCRCCTASREDSCKSREVRWLMVGGHVSGESAIGESFVRFLNNELSS